MELISRWWSRQSGRERGLVLVLLGLLVATGYWFLGLAPGLSSLEQSKSRYTATVRELADVSALANRVQDASVALPSGNRALSAAQSAGTPEQARILITQLATESGVALTRQRPQSDGSLVVEADSVALGSFYNWLAALRDDMGLVPLSATVIARPDSPQVSISVVLSLAGDR